MRPRKVVSYDWINAFFLVLLLCSLGGREVQAQSKALSITADRLEMNDKHHVAIFIGHVVADDGRMRLSAEKMTVFYHKQNAGSSVDGGGGVNEVKAEGQVVIHQDKDKGMADVVHYKLAQRTLELIGKEKDASIRRGDDVLTGRRVLLTLDQDKRISKVSVFGNEHQRVSARITSTGLLKRVESPLRVETPIPLPTGQQTKQPPAEPIPSGEASGQLSPEVPEAVVDPKPVIETPKNVSEPAKDGSGDVDGLLREPTEKSVPAPKPRRRASLQL